MSNFLRDDQQDTVYRVKIGNNVLCERHSLISAELFIENLTEDQKAQAIIVPETVDGKTLLQG